MAALITPTLQVFGDDGTRTSQSNEKASKGARVMTALAPQSEFNYSLNGLKDNSPFSTYFDVASTTSTMLPGRFEGVPGYSTNSKDNVLTTRIDDYSYTSTSADTEFPVFAVLCYFCSLALALSIACICSHRG
jgi:hypothetical protein